MVGMTETDEPRNPEQREETPAEMAQRIKDFIYNKLESEWLEGATVNEMGKRYREVPRPRQFTKQPRATMLERVTRAGQKLGHSVQLLFDPSLADSPDFSAPNPDNRGWRIILQREKDGGATIFYSGYHPKDTPFFGHENGLKVFHAPADGELKVAFIDEVVTPPDSDWLVNAIGSWRNTGKDWRDLLVDYSTLPYGQQIEVRRCLRPTNTLLNVSAWSFLLRGTTFGGEFAAQKWG